ncbi:MAG TPA: hypothetical protein VGM05_05235 [Planctomycetaceae bacterium]|jgi:predicted dehydrogenase
MLQVGLIGLGSEWEQRFRPALGRLSKRLQVRSVYATVGSHAEQAAAELECDAAPGLLALIERDDVRALLILETDWHEGIPVWFACQLGKPVFLAGRLANRLCSTDLHRQAAAAGVTLMPDLGHRYTPVTSRLRELIATRLGRPLTIDIAAGSGGHAGFDDVGSWGTARDSFACAIDWCISLIGTAPTAVVPVRHTDTAGMTGAQQYDVEFRRPSSGGDAARATIRIAAAHHPAVSVNGGATGLLFPQVKIQCANGTALLKPPCGIVWDVGGQPVSESLTADRTDVEVMFDHFSRRVLGGLIPVPTLDDVQRARSLAAALP